LDGLGTAGQGKPLFLESASSIIFAILQSLAFLNRNVTFSWQQGKP